MTTATTPRVDIYTRVGEHIVEELERSIRPWLKPWNCPRTSRSLPNHQKTCWPTLNTPGRTAVIRLLTRVKSDCQLIVFALMTKDAVDRGVEGLV